MPERESNKNPKRTCDEDKQRRLSILRNPSENPKPPADRRRRVSFGELNQLITYSESRKNSLESSSSFQSQTIPLNDVSEKQYIEQNFIEEGTLQYDKQILNFLQNGAETDPMDSDWEKEEENSNMEISTNMTPINDEISGLVATERSERKGADAKDANGARAKETENTDEKIAKFLQSQITRTPARMLKEIAEDKSVENSRRQSLAFGRRESGWTDEEGQTLRYTKLLQTDSAKQNSPKPPPRTSRASPQAPEGEPLFANTKPGGKMPFRDFKRNLKLEDLEAKYSEPVPKTNEFFDQGTRKRIKKAKKEQNGGGKPLDSRGPERVERPSSVHENEVRTERLKEKLLWLFLERPESETFRNELEVLEKNRGVGTGRQNERIEPLLKRLYLGACSRGEVKELEKKITKRRRINEIELQNEIVDIEGNAKTKLIQRLEKNVADLQRLLLELNERNAKKYTRKPFALAELEEFPPEELKSAVSEITSNSKRINTLELEHLKTPRAVPLEDALKKLNSNLAGAESSFQFFSEALGVLAVELDSAENMKNGHSRGNSDGGRGPESEKAEKSHTAQNGVTGLWGREMNPEMLLGSAPNASAKGVPKGAVSKGKPVAAVFPVLGGGLRAEIILSEGSEVESARVSLGVENSTPVEIAFSRSKGGGLVQCARQRLKRAGGVSERSENANLDQGEEDREESKSSRAEMESTDSEYSFDEMDAVSANDRMGVEELLEEKLKIGAFSDLVRAIFLRFDWEGLVFAEVKSEQNIPNVFSKLSIIASELSALQNSLSETFAELLRPKKPPETPKNGKKETKTPKILVSVGKTLLKKTPPRLNNCQGFCHFWGESVSNGPKHLWVDFSAIFARRLKTIFGRNERENPLPGPRGGSGESAGAGAENARLDENSRQTTGTASGQAEQGSAVVFRGIDPGNSGGKPAPGGVVRSFGGFGKFEVAGKQGVLEDMTPFYTELVLTLFEAVGGKKLRERRG